MAQPGRINLHNALELEFEECPKISENYFMKFRNKDDKKLNKFTASQFLDVWNHFDEDGNGRLLALFCNFGDCFQITDISRRQNLIIF